MYRFFVVVFLIFASFGQVGAAYQGKVAFDLDETLIESTELDKEMLEKVRLQGYEIKKSLSGQDYVLRPGARELLDFAKKEGFDLMIYTHNRPDYAKDILTSAGIDSYFSEIRSIEDCKKIYNMNFQTYPNHRNKVHKANDPDFNRYLDHLFRGFVVKSWERFQGNKNIHPYMPCLNCDKYPPLYGARVLFDNSDYNIEDAIDFAGIKVEPFYGLKPEPAASQGQYLWVESIKDDLRYLKEHEWYEFYEHKFGKKPVLDDVPLVNE